MVNGSSEVLKGHCRRSGGGVSYTNYTEFRAALQMMQDEEKYEMMAESAVQYVERDYRWDVVMRAWSRVIDNIAKKNAEDAIE